MKARLRISGGFTLVEMMIVIGLIAILLALAVPSFKDASLGSQLRASANQLVASTTLARSEAIKRNAVVSLCVSSDGVGCGAGRWEEGWIVHQGATVIGRQQAGPPGFKIEASGGLTSVDFQPIGAGATPASFTVCRATPGVGKQERVVRIDATGRASVRTTKLGVCS